MRSRPGFPTRRASALICMAALIANVIKASSPRAAHKGRTYGRTAPVWGQQRKRVPLTAGSFHIWESSDASRTLAEHALLQIARSSTVTSCWRASDSHASAMANVTPRYAGSQRSFTRFGATTRGVGGGR
jgi:hypothetical protein